MISNEIELQLNASQEPVSMGPWNDPRIKHSDHSYSNFESKKKFRNLEPNAIKVNDWYDLENLIWQENYFPVPDRLY